MKLLNLMCVGMLLIVSGCSNSQVAQTDKGAERSSNSQYIALSEPAGAVAVGEARQSVKHDEAVVLVGLIGGSRKPFVDGLAAFTIVDSKVPYCAAEEGCPTPWDYCCTQDQVANNIATIKLVDEAGKPVMSDARELLNVKELSTVVVQGTAQRDDQGNLTVAASRVFVRAAL